MLDAFSIDLLGPPSVSFVDVYCCHLPKYNMRLHVYTACLHHFCMSTSFRQVAIVSLVFLRLYKVYVYIMPSAYMPISILYGAHIKFFLLPFSVDAISLH